ncbi:DUF4167 domain-containing protein [Microvirga sp. BT689]|uniref:DUF4167 domain-containing protein n=1 Tax=Microvirga arvi TaxID=2778731 RepID=UPI00194DB1B5|nr:DUF4167 domain-containing protein [Microvirga arvi]MBM6579754.1 DUF4167 domain-containing protein [Microvirga arvi]
MRGRSNNNRNNNKGPNPLTKSYESNGPDVKIRGTAQHIAEKYSQLARDAQSSGDPVAAENYFQHAEHYFRIIAAAQEQLREQYGYQQPRSFDEDGNEEDGFGQGERPSFERAGASAQDFGNGEEGDYGSQPQPYENRAERNEQRPARFDRNDRQDRGDRQERSDRPDRNDRNDRNDRQDRGDRRDRFQPRDRGPRQDFQPRDEQPFEARPENGERPERNEQRPARFDRGDRPERGDRPDRNDRFERGDRPERRERFPRDRRRDDEVSDQGTLPAFLTNPVRTPAPAAAQDEVPSAAPMVQEPANDEAAVRPRRRRRTRQEMIDAANAENAGFAPDPVETPAAE